MPTKKSKGLRKRCQNWKWISVKDKLPKEEVKVFSYLQDYDEYKIDYIILFPEPIWTYVIDGAKKRIAFV